ncbi:MAG: alpha/beta fold hydrolase [Brumimicrobium sp.]|nr:alpha/beta fold hydrolase [Brumimicrobium sp.]
MKSLKSLWLVATIFIFHFSVTSQTEKDVKIKTEAGKLYGSLMMPEGKGPFPVVLIIAGSGPTDRNCNSGLLQSNAYKMIAQELAKNEIASLRYDKRGVGESAETVSREEALTFEDFVGDANAWIDFLKKQKNLDQIIILGHSEGSLIGMLAAQREDVNKFISVAGAGRPIYEVLLKQLENQPETVFIEAESIIESLKKGDTVSTVSRDLYALFRPSVQGYLISWFKYDPAQELKKLGIPHLIIQGTTDIQVETEEARILEKAVEGEQLILIEEMNHVLKEAPADKNKNIATYYDPKSPLHKDFITPIIQFIRKK